MKTIGEILKTGTSYLDKYGIDDSRLNMQILMCSLLKMHKIDLYLDFDKPLNETEVSLIRNGTVKLRKSYPVQYIVGNTTFYGNTIKVNESVLIPRPETEEMVAKIIKSKQGEDFGGTILDIGTGSGCIAVSLAKVFNTSSVYAVDTSSDALAVAEENASLNGVKNVKYFKLDILTHCPKTKFDLIVSNPPYIPVCDYAELDKNVKDFEPRSALTDDGDGLSFYRRYAEIFPLMLNSGGEFYLEAGYGESDKIKSLFRVTDFKIDVSNDINNVLRFIHGQKI